MRLDLNDANVFNKWRELYDDLTNEEQIAFADACEERFPTQKHYNPQNFYQLMGLERVKPNAKVLEIGGWKGELAKDLLSKYHISSWLNVELCRAAAAKTVPMHDLPYSVHCPDTFDWFFKPRVTNFDVCVSAHTIEHLSDAHLISLMDYISGIKTVMFEAPISENQNDWTDYLGTHKLKMGWNAINESMLTRGYTSEKINDTCRLYTLEIS